MINVTTLERTLAFVELVTRHLTTAWSPIRISPSLNIADRIVEGGKCDVLIKLLNLFKDLIVVCAWRLTPKTPAETDFF